MQGGVRPQELDQIPPCGKLRCWADCVQGPGVKLQEPERMLGVKEAQGTELVWRESGKVSPEMGSQAGSAPRIKAVGSAFWGRRCGPGAGSRSQNDAGRRGDC